MAIKSEQQIRQMTDIGEDFSFSKTSGSLVNNIQSSQGFKEFSNGADTQKSYIWNALSGIADELGQTIYSNYTHYIDLVSDVDICKVSSLKSLMQFLGMDYSIFNEYELFPIDVLNVLNVLSLNKKLFFSNDIVKKQFTDALSAAEVIVGENAGSIDYRQFSDEKYYSFVSAMYHDLLLNKLTKSYSAYNLSSYAFPDVVRERKTASEAAYQSTKYRQLADQWNISPSFNTAKTLDNINQGTDSLDNYQGYELSLLNTILEDRKAQQANDDPTTKYAYYIRDEVNSYISFISNKYYSLSLSSVSLNYEYDSNYYQIDAEDVELFTRIDDVENLTQDQVYEQCIDQKVFDCVVKALADITIYIQQLRNKVKLQTRKNYMKGTNNLLLYVVNEYLMQYFKNNTGISSIQIIKREHDSFAKDLEIIEYDDQTEYSNITTDRDYVSISAGDTCNPRYWVSRLDDDGLNLKLAQIQDFYLSAMGMKCQLSCQDKAAAHSFLTSFLDAVYNSGALADSYNALGFVNTKVGKDRQHTPELYARLILLSADFCTFLAYKGLSTGYEYPSQTAISDQLSDVVENFITPTLTYQCLSAISSVYDKFNPQIQSISVIVDELVADYDAILSGENGFYFHKPTETDYPYSYVSGQYKHPDDYYISSIYDAGLTCIYDKLQALKSFSTRPTSIVNYPLQDAISALSGELYGLSTALEDQVISKIEKYGYIRLSTELLDEQVTNVQSFLTDIESTRKAAVQSNAESLKTTANLLFEKYQALQSSTQDLTAMLSGGPVANMWISFGTGATTCSEHAQYIRSSSSKVGYTKCYNDKYWYKHITGAERGTHCAYPALTNTNLQEVFATDSVNQILSGTIAYLEQPTSVSCISSVEPQEHYLDWTTGKMDLTAYSRALDLSAQVVLVHSQTNTAIKQYNAMIKDSTLEPVEINNLKAGILSLVEAVTKPDFVDTALADDVALTDFRKYLAIVKQISSMLKSTTDYYTSLCQESTQQSYLSGLKNISKFTLSNLRKILNYISTTDESRRESILGQLTAAIEKYLAAVDSTVQLVSDLSQERTIPPRYYYSGEALEVELSQISSFLLTDISNKHDEGIQEFGIERKVLDNAIGGISAEIEDKLSSDDNFETAVECQLSALNFFEHDDYKTREKLFLSYYGGTFCYYPYSNFNNVEHPSYQIHPFLWNLVEHQTVAEQVVKYIDKVYSDDFEEQFIAAKISAYIGELGQVVDEWKNHVYDFTGYVSRYEDSSHKSDSNLTSEVIDFDGGFYPAAVNELTADPAKVLSSLQLFIADNMRPTSRNFAWTTASEVFDDHYYTYTGNDVIGLVQLSWSPYATIDTTKAHLLKELTNDGQLSSALSLATTVTDLVDAIQEMIPATFFEKFYDHLDMSKGDAQQELNRLSTYLSEVLEMTRDHDLSSAYDIYKYGLDSFGNAYLLYKQYGKDDPTYAEKRDAVGSLWIRRKDYPFAYPAFTGKFPSFDMQSVETCHPAIYRLDKTYDSTSLSALEDVRCFFDFSFSQSKATLVLCTMQTDHGHKISNGSVEGKFNADRQAQQFKTLESCALVFAYPRQTVDSDHDDMTVLASYSQAAQVSNPTECIFSADHDVNERPEVLTADAEISAYHYVGSFTTGLDETYFAYAFKSLSSDGSVKLIEAETDQIRLFELDGQQLVENVLNPANCTVNSRQKLFDKTIDGQICLSYADYILTFAHLVPQTAVDASRCKGASVSNPNYSETNTRDVFEQSVKIVKTSINEDRLVLTDAAAVETNVNADMSYIPVYASLDLSNCVKLVENPLQTDYLTIELLGKSKDLDQLDKDINTSTDPYYDYENVRANYEVGRAYEDYLSTDTNITCISNPTTLYPTGDYIAYSTVPFTTTTDLAQYHVLIMTDDTAGKFPYFVGTLDQLQNVVKAKYDPALEDEPVASVVRNYKQTVVGVNPYSRFSFKSNHIEGVKDMFLQLHTSGTSHHIEVTMSLDGTKPTSCTFVKQKHFKIIVFNKNDLHVLEKFHILDSFGLLYAYDLDKDTAHRYIADMNGWHIVTTSPDAAFDEEKDKLKLKSYYIDKYGFKNFVKDVNITDEESLKSLWLFSASKSLQFKEDESAFYGIDDRRHYFPSLNYKYPSLVADEYDATLRTYVLDGACINDLYADDEVYILSTLDPVLVADNISQISIKTRTVDTEEETYHAYEDILSSSVIEGISVQNFKMYDVLDIENLSLVSSFIHSFETETVSSEVSGTAEEIKNMIAVKDDLIDEKASDLNQIVFDASHDNIQLSDYLNVLVSFKKAESGDIELNFNYFNKLDNRFISFDSNGKPYYTLVPGTYLKLKKDEDGILDICVQVKNYDIFGDITSAKMLRLASYHIYNISDDKPKFLMDKTYDILPGDGVDRELDSREKLKLRLSNAVIDLRDYDESILPTQPISFAYTIAVETTDTKAIPFSFDISLPNMLSADDQSTRVFSASTKNGMAHVDVHKKTGSVSLRCTTAVSLAEMKELVGSTYLISVVKVDSQVKSSCTDGTLQITYVKDECVLSQRPSATTEDQHYLGLSATSGQLQKNELYRINT